MAREGEEIRGWIGDDSTSRGLFGLFVGNGAAMVAAVVLSWELADVLWIYWAQSVIIGLANFARMMKLKHFSTSGMKSNGKPIPETEAGKRSTAIFFLIHYGFFHFVYLGFVSLNSSLSDFTGWGLLGLVGCVASFAWSHSRSLRLNQDEDFKDKKPNLGTLMFYPYLRIIPMHLTIIFGSILGGAIGAVLLFMCLKTAADIGMHKLEHRLFRDSPSDQVAA